MGGYDVCKKEDLDRLVAEVGRKEAHVNILGKANLTIALQDER